MLEIMGKKTGAFEVVQGDDMALFKPESLRRFDAVCFDNTTQLKFEDASLRKALMDFVKGGKGVIGIHAATDNFYDWPEAAEMMGGTFDGHPWTSDGTWKVAIEDPDHPLMASFKGQGFSIRDEIYRTKQSNLRKNHRVLMGLDTKDEHNRGAVGVRNSDKDIPISWIGTLGKGRIFYCSLGHNKEVYWNPAVVSHYLAGIQYALGDLEADATPVPFNSASFFDQRLLDQLLKDVSSYTYGQSRKPMQDLDAFVRYVSDITGAQEKIEQQFLALLRSGATPAGKQFIGSRLGHIGTGASVPPLVVMLADSTTRDMAMYALEHLPGEAVNDSLCRALPAASGRMKCGIISAMGRRRAAGAVGVIQPYLAVQEEEVAVAAASALGEIGNHCRIRGPHCGPEERAWGASPENPRRLPAMRGTVCGNRGRSSQSPDIRRAFGRGASASNPACRAEGNRPSPAGKGRIADREGNPGFVALRAFWCHATCARGPEHRERP